MFVLHATLSGRHGREKSNLLLLHDFYELHLLLEFKIEVLRLLLENYAEKLPDQFVVVTETQVRFAKT
jgi:hypothetical protein